MAFEISFRPPAINPVAALAASKHGAEEAGAHVLLAASQPLVPVDSGELKASGHVDTEGIGAAVVYERTNSEFNVAVWVHEDMTAHHPNGGQAHYLSEPLDTARPAVLTAVATVIAAAL